MRIVPAASNAARSETPEEPDESPVTPRGMAGPPAPPATLRFESDPSRPATIRIEANNRADPGRRGDLERELDRVHGTVGAEQAAFGQQLNWLLLSQGLLLNAFVVLLVFGWSSPLPGRRLLLGGIALTGAALAVFIYLALRGSRDALQALRKARRDLEARLEKDFRRAPLYSAHGGFTRGLGHAAARALPATFIAGWIALTLYAVALPSATRASEEARAATIAPPAAAPPARAPARTVASQAAPASVEAVPVKQSSDTQAPKRSPFKW
jgi:hypothetical protein